MEKDFIEAFKEALEIEDHEVMLEDEFRSYEEWNSLSYLSLIAMLDDKYEAQIEEDDFNNLKTVADIYNVIKK